MNDTQRIGVLGGTFDPVHLGHHDVAVVARRMVGLHRILLVPARVPQEVRDARKDLVGLVRAPEVLLVDLAHAELEHGVQPVRVPGGEEGE